MTTKQNNETDFYSSFLTGTLVDKLNPTPRIKATTVNPCAKIRALIMYWLILRSPCLKLYNPNDRAPAVAKQPMTKRTDSR